MFYLVSVSSCNDPGLLSVLSIVRRILSLIQIIGPILALVSLSIHLIRLVKNPEDKNGMKRVHNSVLALMLLFFIPMMVNVVFGWLDTSTTLSSCWNSADYKQQKETTYVPVEGDKKKTTVITNPGDYEKGTPKPTPSTSSGGSSSTFSPTSADGTGGSLVKQEETETLKVAIYKKSGYYITKIWVKDPYMQLNKYDSPSYGSALYKPGYLLQQAANQNNLSNKLIVGFNASGFYLKGTYDVASVNAYPAYDRTSVGTLVITNGRVVRNAYSHAVKTWYIAGVDSSGQMRIYEDAKSNDANAKKAWSESVIGQIRNTFTFASPLVENGQASSNTTSMPSPSSGVNRQAMCQIDQNNFLLITGASLSRNDLITIMLQNNCKTGTNFDGGGSIALLYKSKNSQTIETIIGNRRALTEVGYFTE